MVWWMEINREGRGDVGDWREYCEGRVAGSSEETVVVVV